MLLLSEPGASKPRLELPSSLIPPNTGAAPERLELRHFHSLELPSCLLFSLELQSYICRSQPGASEHPPLKLGADDVSLAAWSSKASSVPA